ARGNAAQDALAQFLLRAGVGGADAMLVDRTVVESQPRRQPVVGGAVVPFEADLAFLFVGEPLVKLADEGLRWLGLASRLRRCLLGLSEDPRCRTRHAAHRKQGGRAPHRLDEAAPVKSGLTESIGAFAI